MAILNPDHFFQQAERLIVPPSAGAPRQVDIRRAISAAYYGVFHATLMAAADQFVGVSKRSSSQYGLVYRSVDHKWLRILCGEIKKPRLGPKCVPHAPAGGFGADVSMFAGAVLR